MEHYKIDITEEQRDNLKKLADYLLSGNLRAEFDIGRFADSFNQTQTNCGTVGCAIGHGPDAGIVKWKNEDWVKYSFRNFGSEYDPFQEDELFDWCFSSDWENIDNTPDGAAKRILYMLEKGIPKDYLNQSCGDSPLCY